MLRSRQLSRIFKRSSCGIVRPVGLFGLHKKTRSRSSVRSSQKSSCKRKPFSFCSRYIRIKHPAAESAASYSANPGAAISAFFGRRACVRAKISSAAPFANRIFSSGSCSFSDSARVRSRHSASGYCSTDSALFLTASFTLSGAPRGLTFTEKSTLHFFV